MKNEFKIGDKVERVKSEWMGMKVGDIGTVSGVFSYDTLMLEHTITLEEFKGDHTVSNLKLQPKKDTTITKDKKYKYRGGGDARILCVDAPSQIYPVISMNKYGTILTHTMTGMLFHEGVGESTSDLIEMKPYEDFKIDDRVYVWGGAEDGRLRRYFAGLDTEGRPTAFCDGVTSWSGSGKRLHWNNCVKAEE